MTATNGELWAQLDRLMTQYEKTTKHLSSVQEKVPTLRGEASSADGLVTVTVGARGNVVGLTISPRAFRRLSPTELAEMIVATAEQAGRAATSQMQELVAPFLPKDVKLEDLMSGNADFSQFAPKEPLTAENFDQWWEQFGWRPDGKPGGGR